MVYKNNDFKTDKKQYRKIIFSLLMLIYAAGMCAGCTYACKNSQNLGFVSQISVDENILKTSASAFLGSSVRYFIRDTILFITVIILKYSGVLKGLCATVPFIFSLQNGCIYIGLYTVNADIMNIMLNHALKDAAIAFLLLIYCFITIYDIISARENPRKDLQKLRIYLVGVICIYVIDYTIKLLIFNYI